MQQKIIIEIFLNAIKFCLFETPYYKGTCGATKILYGGFSAYPLSFAPLKPLIMRGFYERLKNYRKNTLPNGIFRGYLMEGFL